MRPEKPEIANIAKYRPRGAARRSPKLPVAVELGDIRILNDLWFGNQTIN
jgi:hypothetical protein